jgi:ribosome-associated protein
MERINDRQLSKNITGVLEDKKGYDIVAYNVAPLTTFTNYIIISSFNSRAQLKSVVREIKGGIDSNPRHVEGDGESGWILLDFDGVIVNLFLEDTRKFYRLERLWGKAGKIGEIDV